MRDLSRVRLWNSSVERQRFESKTTRRRARPQLKRKPLQKGKVRCLLRARVLLGMHRLMGRPRLRVRVLLGTRLLMERLRLRAWVLLQMQSLVRLQPERVLLRMRLQMRRLQMRRLVKLRRERVQ